MANYKLVNADQLDADMTSVADSIRAKAGTSEQLEWPSGYKTAIDSISTGSAVQRASGSFPINDNEGIAIFGFEPDLVFIYKKNGYWEDEDGETYFPSATFAFYEESRTTYYMNTMMYAEESANYEYYDLYCTPTSSGFDVLIYAVDGDWRYVSHSGTFYYTAIKYT